MWLHYIASTNSVLKLCIFDTGDYVGLFRIIFLLGQTNEWWTAFESFTIWLLLVFQQASLAFTAVQIAGCMKPCYVAPMMALITVFLFNKLEVNTISNHQYQQQSPWIQSMERNAHLHSEQLTPFRKRFWSRKNGKEKKDLLWKAKATVSSHLNISWRPVILWRCDKQTFVYNKYAFQ